MVKKIISGGQTGADRMGLEVGRKLGLETGGTAPRGFKTEHGCDFTLEEFGLVQDESADYPPRTEKNVQASDGTVLFGNPYSTGSKLTIRLCRQHNKPCRINPTVESLQEWVIENNIEVLNVAGNRGSKLSARELEKYEKILTKALTV